MFRRISLFLAFVVLTCPGLADAASARAVLYPLAFHAPADMDHLRQGVHAMLVSRLSASGGLAFVGTPSAPAPQTAAELAAEGRRLKVDHVLSGSIFAAGSGVSIDMLLVPTAGAGEGKSFHAAAADAGGVIAAVEGLAREIGARIAGRPEAPTAAAALPAAAGDPFRTEHPERALLSGSFGGAYSAKSLLERPQGISNPFGFSKSQNFSMDLRSMDVGDVDGDGIPEVVLADRSEIRLFRVVEGRYKEMGRFAVLSRFDIHALAIADLDGDGKGEIYGSAADNERPSSFGLRWNGTALVPLFSDQHWFIRPLQMEKGQKMVLAGQRASKDMVVEQGIYRLSVGAGALRQEEALALPPLGLFSFVRADLEGKGLMMTVAVGDDGMLTVYSSAGKQLWTGSRPYGGTARVIGGPTDEQIRRGDDTNLRPFLMVPARMVAMDLDGDGIDEVCALQNILTSSPLFRSVRKFYSGAVSGLAWNGIGLEPLWQTREIDGNIVDFQVERVKADAGGKKAGASPLRLYVGMQLARGMLDLGRPDAAVLTFTVTPEAVERKAKDR